MNRISIVIPVLNEAEGINSLIDHIHSQKFHESYEIIVVDGDPDGTTINAIQHEEIKTTTSAKGRARQMNVGAGLAEGEILLFLHADTLLPDDGLNKISSAMEDKQFVAGAFDLGMDTSSLALKIIVYIASRRSRLSRIPYGDQGIFIRRDYFNRIGCYKDIPLMEDVELMRRIKKMGDKIHIIPDRVSTSARRWEEDGVARCSARNIIIATLYCLGVSPEKLVRHYRRRRNVYKNS